MPIRKALPFACLLCVSCAVASAADPAGAAACFAEDGIGVYCQDCVGPKAIAERLTAILAHFHATSHHLSNVLIRLDGARRRRSPTSTPFTG